MPLTTRSDLPSADEKESLTDARAEMKTLLRRYPNLDDGERRRLARLMTKGPIIDIAMISSDPEVGGQYHLFKQECGALLRPTAFEVLLFFLICVAAIGVVVWAVALAT